MAEVEQQKMTQETPPKPAAKKRSPRAMLATVVVLIAVAFGAGLLLGLLLSRESRQALQKDKADLQASAASLSRDAEAARSRAFLWQLAEGVEQVRVNLAEKNYGLARDAAAGARRVLDAGPDLTPELRAQVSALGPMLADIQNAADALAPDTKSKATGAADLLKRILESSPAAPGSTQAQAPQGAGTKP